MGTARKQKRIKKLESAQVDKAILKLYKELETSIPDEYSRVIATAKIYAQSVLIAYKDKQDKTAKA